MKNLVTVMLLEGIKRGDKEIKELTLRRPKAGELRGLKILDLVNLDTQALMTFLPRITMPSINSQELGQMELSDFMTLSAEAISFFAAKDDVATDSHIE
ncbi:hypothetical protein AAEX37_01005 [Oligella sp. MSHR50489EDL]